MCLGVPARIVSLSEGSRAEAEIGGIRREIDLTLLPEAGLGDYVLVHVGYAIQRIDEAAALETLRLFREIAELADEVH